MTSAADMVGYLAAALLLSAALFLGGRRGGGVGAFVMFLAVFSHLLLAWLNFDGAVSLADPDDRLFQKISSEFFLGWRGSDFKIPSSLMWSYGISYLFHPFGYSVWLAYVVNAGIFLLALDQLGKFATDVGARRHQWMIILLFAFVPSSLLNLNFLLRENFQVLMLIVAIRYLEYYRSTGSVRSILLAAAALVPFGLIHNGFYLFGPMALAGTVFARAALSPRYSSKRKSGRAFTILMGISLTIAALALLSSLEGASRISQILEGDIDIAGNLDSAEVRGARTVFPWSPGEGLFGLALGAPLLLVQFVFAPIIPFMVRSGPDIVAGIDTLVRAAFIFLTYLSYKSADRDGKIRIIYLLGMYLSFCLLAAVGTTTVGTAMRHHLKVFWIIITLGFISRRRVGGRAASLPIYSA